MGFFAFLAFVVLLVLVVAATHRPAPRDTGPPPRVEPPAGDGFYGLIGDQPPVQAWTPAQHLPPYDVEPRRRTISMAIRYRWDVEIVYCDADGAWTARIVSPEWLGGASSGRALGGRGMDNRLFGGWCHLRRDGRTFRLDRVLAIEVQLDDPEKRDRYRVLDG